MERQKNVLQIEALATEAITTAVRGLLPVKQILRDYLDAGDQEELDDDVAPAPAAPAPVAEADVAEPEQKPSLEVEEMLPPKPVAPAVPVPAAPEPETKAEEKAAVAVTKEEAPAPPPTPASEPAAPPAVVKIDTEPATVHFSDYDDVHEEHGEPEIRFSPKGELGEDDEEEEGLEIDESSARPLTDDLDLEDFDKPAAPVPTAAPAVEEELEIENLD